MFGRNEVFAAIFLDTQNGVICFIELFYGILDSCAVHRREVVKRAIELNGASIIFAHNHPSGVAEPRSVQKRLEGNNKNPLKSVVIGAPSGIRTHDPCLRRAVLYPAELWARTRAAMIASLAIRVYDFIDFCCYSLSLTLPSQRLRLYSRQRNLALILSCFVLRGFL